MCLKNLFKKQEEPEEREKPSPADIVPRDNISLQEIDSSVVVSIDLTGLHIGLTQKPKVWIPSIPDTNSMDPNFDMGHNNILIAGADEEEQDILVNSLVVGDIAVYDVMGSLIIHRIVEIGHDNEGKRFRFKGDNNKDVDIFVVRTNQIKWVSIGTIY